MKAYDMLRQVLQTEATQAASEFGFKLVLANEEALTPKAQVWGEFWHRTGKAIPTLGGGRKHFKKAPGLMQFTLYAPEKTGDGAITRIADSLEQRFSSKQYLVPPDGYVTLDDIAVDMLPKRESGSYVCIVHATFDFTYRDPNAI
jgi:hypothetical protein